MRDPIRLWKRPDAVDWEGPGKYAPMLEVNKDTTYVVHSKDGQDGPRKYWGPRELVDFLGADKVVEVLCAAAQVSNGSFQFKNITDLDVDNLIDTVEELL